MIKQKGMVHMKGGKTYWTWLLSMAMAVSLTACGGTETGTMPEAGRGKESGAQAAESGSMAGGGSLAEASAYVSELLSMEGENIDYGGMKFIGDSLLFLSDGENQETTAQNLCRYNLKDSSMVQNPLIWPEEGQAGYLRNYTFAEDGSLYAVYYIVPEGANGSGDDLQRFAVKFNPDGNWVGSWEITKQLEEDNGGSAVSIAADGKGHLYLAGHTLLWLYDGDGTYKGSLSVGGSSRINAMGCDGDGRMYVSYHPEGREDGCTLARIDFDGRKMDTIAADFPYCSGTSFSPSSTKGLLVQDGTALYEYSLEEKKKEKVLVWADCSIGGSWVTNVSALEDDRLLTVLSDSAGGNSGVIVLTGADAEQVPQKETLVMGTLYVDYASKDAIDRYNMNNEKYTIQIKEYADETALNLDIISGRCPDIIEFGNLHVEYMIEKGMFEDLTPYLENSSKLSREDFFEGILNAYVFDGIQAAVPYGFDLITVLGRTSDVGTGMGWTLDEMLDFAEAHQGIYLFDDSKSSVMRNLMRYNESLFVDWETGSCSFDSDRFKHLLEVVNSGPEQVSWELGRSSVSRVKEGEALLLERVPDFEEIQVLEEIFGGEVTFKGLPTPGRSSGATVAWSSAYGITSKSKYKQEAWAFLESFLVESDRFSGCYPALKQRIENQVLSAMKINHDGVVYGEHTGEIDGEPYTYRAAAQEEVDRVLALVDAVEPLEAQCDREIQIIISEEADAYFKGQKTVDEVAQIIQGRVQIYVNERM